MNRREFLTNTTSALAALPTVSRAISAPVQPGRASGGEPDWAAIRALFPLQTDLVHMSGFYLATHARPIQAVIDRHRKELDAEPLHYVSANNLKNEAAVTSAAGEYMGTAASDIALTDSTTMGLGLLLTGLKLKAGAVVVTSTHDHFSTEMALDICAQRTGAVIKRIPLYRDVASVSIEEVVGSVKAALSPATRVLMLTWVHSSTGLKLPIRLIAEVVAEANRGRTDDDRILFCVDGVHGFGVEDATMPSLGCDAFAAGTHKWVFGPRGTGVLWARPEAWARVWPSIPSWYGPHWQSWVGWRPAESMPIGMLMTPGGFHTFENRWALVEAFRLHLTWGKPAVAKRIHALATATKEGLRSMKHVTLRTPMPAELSSGIVCFDVAGVRPQDVVTRLRERGVVASTTPYRTIHARLSPGLLTLDADVEKTLRAVRELRVPFAFQGPTPLEQGLAVRVLAPFNTVVSRHGVPCFNSCARRRCGTIR